MTNTNKTRSPLVAIVTVSFNAVGTIEQTLISAINQDFVDYEYIIVDGGSTDGTVDVIKKYETIFLENGLILKWISEPDKGIFDAINKGLNIASAQYLLIIGADDILSNSNVLSRFDRFDKIKDAVVYGDVFALDDKKIYDGSFNKIKLILRNISHQAIFYPKKVYKNEMYILDYKLASDYEYNIRIWGKGIVFQRINMVVVDFNQTGLGTLNEDKLFLNHKTKIIYRNLGLQSWVIAVLQKIKIILLGKKIVFNFFR
ncbi:glycosyltransferase family 2 protein [Flavobacterium pectinovorum]|uniref:glycosyltransferase family 2 protein n=1 Tax=Flavobacterium pectinovorum TaxID=29533 RepID=UPI00265F4479|nr:glycosyltransferase family 2 protein [Flavobacterium pectinovorum]WKL45994.1 glycosyltransferase family 2 protein [Flavobacterium pectinovorum]